MSESLPTPATIERTLHVTCLRAGMLRSDINQSAWTVLPYTLVGQTREDALMLLLQDGTTCHIAKGGGYLIPEGLPHRIGPMPPKRRMYYWSHLHLRVAGELNLFQILKSPVGLPPSVGRKIGRINRGLTMTELHPSKNVLATAAQRKQFAHELLNLIVDVCELRPGAQQTFMLHARLAPVLQWINDRLDQPITRETMAAEASLSPSRFHALFQAATGQAPMQYVQARRLRRAQELLLSTDMPIQQVAETTGFNDPFHFSRLFKKSAGQSPREYRKAVRASMSMH